MEKKEYHKWSKEKLVHEVKRLLKRKKFGLVWEDKPEEVAEKCKEFLPVLKEDKKKKIITDKNAPVNILIEGDNYHSLSVLNYTHKKKIDVIYLDPPYNTGAKDWKYNNRYVDENDRYRHSKWISMMYKRLSLAKHLLSNSGILICAIDEYEIHNIRHILDQLFGERNKLGMVTVLHNPKGRNLSKFFSANSEYMLVYAKNINLAKFNNVAIDEEVLATFNMSDDDGNYRLEPFMRIRSTWTREKKPKCWYPIYVSKNLKKITLEKTQGYHEVFPRTSDSREMAWKNIPQTFMKLNKNGYFVARKQDGYLQIYHVYREKQVFKNVWTNKKYQSEFNGTNLLKKILGGNYFSYPKSLYLILDILKITTGKNSVILDFFAGSGTTGHAVLELNKQDGGNRQFILCTNNEDNNGDGNKIATDICYPRVKNVINGYSNSGEKTAGLGGNLRYYQTDFVERVKTDNDKRILVSRSTEMLCLAENTFDKILAKKDAFTLYENKKQITGIIYDEDAIVDFRKAIEKFNKPLVVYVFSYDHSYNEEYFTDIPNLIKVKPIPEVILNTYKKIYKTLRKSKQL